MSSAPMPCPLSFLLPFLASCSLQVPTPVLLAIPALCPFVPPLPHLSLPHVSPAGYGAARALNKQAWPRILFYFFHHVIRLTHHRSKQKLHSRRSLSGQFLSTPSL
ncbi:hypothetical protein EDB84DRAFT_1515195, partial [Lactarius hengduanensis]